MTTRRYNDEEVAAIFERASEAPPPRGRQPRSVADGMTLAELQEIGREVGIAPESVALAARALDQRGAAAARRFLGFPIGVERTIELDRQLSDDEWERLVVDLRETFDARGMVRYDGPFRQWTNGNLQALLEPTATGHRIRLRTVKGDARSLMAGGLAILGGGTATLIAMLIARGASDLGAVAAVGFLAAMGLGMFLIGALRLPGWARLRQRQMEDLATRLAAEPHGPPQLPTGEE